MNISHEIRGIFLRPLNTVNGRPVFIGHAQEFREFHDRVELWERNGDGQMQFVTAWPKQAISHFEYKEIPNIWMTLNPTIRL